MKINKKIIVPFLSTVVGLSVAGGLGGAFAWYQFNSQVRTGFIGTSVADTGLIQIGYDNGSGIEWGREKFLPDTDLIPVTFGALNSDGSLGAKAYGYPEAGKQNGNDYTSGWQEIANEHGYYQYDIYLRALKADKNAVGDPTNDINPGYKLVEQDVYLTEMTLEGVKQSDNSLLDDDIIADALRVHYSVNDSDTNKKGLISNTAKTINLYDQLDLDADGEPDTYDVNNWDSKYGQTLTYGINGQTQTTAAITDVLVARESDGTIATNAAKRICKTKTSGDMTKITITVWLEGWQVLDAGGTANSDIWNPNKNAGVGVHVGMVFDVGRNILG